MTKEFSLETMSLEDKCVNTIRFLSVDAVERARSGHPGTPMGMADMAWVLWTEFLRHDPAEPSWANRDRFLLSAGHASMLLYSLLHLTGYEAMSLDELRNFRQMGSRTAGHPEYGHAPGIEVTTGPLGQGFANGVGMALAARMMAARFNGDEFDPVDHFVYAFCSDGDLMEGISAESASLAGHLGLGNLIYFYDDNGITIEGGTTLSLSEDPKRRFEAQGWHVQSIDGHDRNQIRKAIRRARRKTDRPSLIICRTVIGWGSPNLAGKAEVHGAPLGPEETRETKKAIGWPEEPAFLVPEGVREEFARRTKKLARARKSWYRKMRKWRAEQPEKAALWDRFWSHDLPADYVEQLLASASDPKGAATRSISGQVIQKLAEIAPFVIGGSADLAPSNNTIIKASSNLARQVTDSPPAESAFLARNLHFGVREHAMGAIINGMTLYGSWRAYGGTFLIFSDYMRPSIRLAALMNIPSIFVFTHDSVFLGEDGPTHQPIEQLAALRAIPGLTLFRPADRIETAMAWAWAAGQAEGPTAFALTRQKLEPLVHDEGFDPQTIWKGAYVLREDADAAITIVATGSEVPLAVAAADKLGAMGISSRIVSAPSLDLFEEQGEEYQSVVLGEDRSRIVVIEAGRTTGWYRWVDHSALVIGIDEFGVSAPWEKIAEHFGFTPDAIAARVTNWLDARAL